MNEAAVKSAEELFKSIAKSLAQHPDAVHVETRRMAASTSIFAKMDSDDAGSVIGRGGRTIRSINMLAEVGGALHRWPVSLAVKGPKKDNPARADRPEPAQDLAWSPTMAAEQAKALARWVFEMPATVALHDFDGAATIEVVPHTDEMEPRCAISTTFPGTTESVLYEGDEAVRYALSTIFAAVGRVHGYRLEVSYVRRQPPVSSTQPGAADGRFSKAVVA